MSNANNGNGTTAIQVQESTSLGAALLEKVLVGGDLAELSAEERLDYLRGLCKSLGLNPLTKPFEYIELDKKLTLYARKDATEQLRKLQGISIEFISRTRADGIYTVVARATTPDGRTDEASGSVSLEKEDGSWETANNGKRFFKGNGKWVDLHGDALANALMKCETKAKRRVTLSICGLGFLDESELDTIPTAKIARISVNQETGEVIEGEATVLEERPAPPAKKSQRKANYERFQTQADTLGLEESTVRWFCREVAGTDAGKEIDAAGFAHLASELELYQSDREVLDWLAKRPAVKIELSNQDGDTDPEDLPF